MNFVGKIVISTLTAAAAWALLQFVAVIPAPLVLIIATLATAFLVTLPGGSTAPTAKNKPARKKESTSAPAAAVPDGPREEGEVKWFNVSKGFGFVTKDDGEEIFVHFRSIRGEGRRGLRDGQRVSFVVATTDKGPQAEDVEPL